MNGNIASRAYTQVGLETGVSAADPHRLILMLYDGALHATRLAQAHLQARRVGPKGECVSKAIQIIEEGLRVSLDKTVGGPIAGQLDDLYEYMCRRLLLASAANDPAGLAEVVNLLASLRDAWAALADARTGASSANPSQPRVSASPVRPL